jgi:hypothetical protein
MTNDFRQILLRELRTWQRELEAYPDERQIWALPAGAVNSAGTLTLHVSGSLLHLIGAQLGETGYVRNRDAEFADRDVPRAQLLRQLEETIGTVDRVMGSLEASAIDRPFPIPVGGRVLPTRLLLIHLCGHLSYHLGQVDYHRRLVTGDSRGVGALALAELTPA